MKHVIAMVVGGAILTAIAGFMFAIPNGEAMLLVISLLMIAYGLGSMVMAYVNWINDSKRIDRMKEDLKEMRYSKEELADG